MGGIKYQRSPVLAWVMRKGALAQLRLNGRLFLVFSLSAFFWEG